MSPEERAAVLSGIAPGAAAAHYPLLRTIFRAEMGYRAEQPAGDRFENLYHCAFLLHCVGDVQDVETMWEAKHIDFDTGLGFDLNFLVGAGVSQTVAYLRSIGRDDIADGLAGADDGAELARWRQFRQRYFYPQA
mgnify:CR=1 FL=1